MSSRDNTSDDCPETSGIEFKSRNSYPKTCTITTLKGNIVTCQVKDKDTENDLHESVLSRHDLLEQNGVSYTYSELKRKYTTLHKEFEELKEDHDAVCSVRLLKTINEEVCSLRRYVERFKRGQVEKQDEIVSIVKRSRDKSRSSSPSRSARADSLSSLSSSFSSPHSAPSHLYSNRKPSSSSLLSMSHPVCTRCLRSNPPGGIHPLPQNQNFFMCNKLRECHRVYPKEKYKRTMK